MDLKELESGVDPKVHWYYQSKKVPLFRYFKKVAAATDRPLNVIDFGSGSGFFAYELYEAFPDQIAQVLLIDIGYTEEELASTAEQKVLLKKLLQIMYAYEREPLCEVVNAIRDFENSLLQRYAPKRIQAVLVAASVGRYSLAYWDARLQNAPSSAWNWRKIFTAVADGIGAAGGAVAGSATVIGGIAGGLAGGISASVGFSRVWDIFS